MTETVQIISPIDGKVFAERQTLDGPAIAAAVSRARAAQAFAKSAEADALRKRVAELRP